MQMQHYIQLTQSGKFEQFDYGLTENLVHYNSSTPPEYNLKNVVAPIYLYHAAQDLLVPESVNFLNVFASSMNFNIFQSVLRVKLLLPNVQGYRVIQNWNHIDFTYGKNVRKVLYKDFLKSFKKIQYI